MTEKLKAETYLHRRVEWQMQEEAYAKFVKWMTAWHIEETVSAWILLKTHDIGLEKWDSLWWWRAWWYIFKTLDFTVGELESQGRILQNDSELNIYNVPGYILDIVHILKFVLNFKGTYYHSHLADETEFLRSQGHGF